ncbi:phosphatase PAP2 family protein [Calditrichota bacterium GD2]
MQTMVDLDRLTTKVGYLRRAGIILLLYLVHSHLYNYIGVHAVSNNLNLMTGFDRLFPFIPVMVYPYMSLYAGIFLVAMLLKGKDFLHFVGTLITIELITYPVFYFFPAVYPMPQFEVNNFTTRFLQWCFQADVHNNTFPSLHVSLAMGTALVINNRHKKAGKAAILWAVVVAFSTVLVKKHFFIDVMGGMVVAQAAYSLAVKNEYMEKWLNELEQKWQKAPEHMAIMLNKLNTDNLQHSKAFTLLFIFLGLK